MSTGRRRLASDHLRLERIAKTEQELSADSGRIREAGDRGLPTVCYRRRREELAG